MTIAVAGAAVVEALEAAEEIDAEVVCLTSADLVFRALQARPGWAPATGTCSRGRSRRRARSSPWSTATRTRSSFLAAVNGAPIAWLGVSEFGQSGDIGDLYRHHGIDAETIIGAALDLMG